ncbi:hypothetical protein RND71_004348 [Anisodus tanguticus]|uniref:F-box domain-containing protein n=1 Tax=Anisodus tanguticus TaxID=243964 RepID=A0AAE1VQW8_9SOLA|nr:hypothetical protein RND71_004348 [Anisodus tanguticus]
MDSMCTKLIQRYEDSHSRSLLPDEIVFNILSFLPPRPLYRFKCVCKLWNTLFLHPFFLYLHYLHSPCSALVDEDVRFFIDLDIKCRRRGFRPICQSSHGLLFFQEDGKKLGYEVLTLEIGHLNNCPCWRAIPSNSKYSDDDDDGRRKKRKSIEHFFRMGVAYCIWFVVTEKDDDDLMI